MKQLFFSILLAAGLAVADAEAPPALPAEVVARINGHDVPAAWFLHEFRSTFFRHPPSEDIRQVVFAPFIKRMMLAAKAREQGLDQQETLKREIARRLEDMRAFMDYQLAMAEITMLNEALMKELGISVSPEDISREVLERFFDQHIKSRPGAPASLDQVPAHLNETIRSQAAQMHLEKMLDQVLDTWRDTMTVEINEDAVTSVPFPEMTGPVPPGFQPPTSD